MKPLSDKIMPADNKKKDNGFYWEKDVKKAIKELNKFVDNFLYGHEDEISMFKEGIKEIFGSELVE